MLKNLDEVMQHVKDNKKKKIAIVAAEDKEIIEVVEEATKSGLAEFIFIGSGQAIYKVLNKGNKQCNYEIIDEPNHERAAEKAVELVHLGKAEALMKGNIHTGVFLKAILNKEKGLNLGRLISQVSIFDKEYGEGLQFLTDCAIAIEPTLEDKKVIIENAISFAIKLGYSRPKVALLSAIEVVNYRFKDTYEAAVLSKMGDRGQIKNAIIDGPFALDNAISPEAAEYKGIKGEVAGQADILVVPNLQVGNVLSKSITFYAHKGVASAVLGAGAPIIMTSRTDSLMNKILSIAIASYIS
jgi:phosphate butyryltransferase